MCLNEIRGTGGNAVCSPNPARADLGVIALSKFVYHTGKLFGCGL